MKYELDNTFPYSEYKTLQSVTHAKNEDEESELINFVAVWKKKLQRKGYDLNTNQIYKFIHRKLYNRYNYIEHQAPRILKSQRNYRKKNGGLKGGQPHRMISFFLSFFFFAYFLSK